jgi:hypothetical protein
MKIKLVSLAYIWLALCVSTGCSAPLNQLMHKANTGEAKVTQDIYGNVYIS